MPTDYVPPAFAEHFETAPPKVLYHYTGQAGLLGIVGDAEVGNAELWCTKLQYMNDATEFGRALAMARSRLDALIAGSGGGDSSFSDPNSINWRRGRACTELRRSLDGLENINLFAACFCEDGDLLSQWRGYAGGGYGFAIGFDTQIFAQLTTASDFTLGKCIYDAGVQRAIVEQAVEHCITLAVESTMGVVGFHGPLANILFQCGAFFKDRSFEGEKEWRLISPIVRVSDPCFAFRSGRSMLTPYYKLSIASDSIRPIVHVIVGPCPHMELSKSSVMALVMKNDVIKNKDRGLPDDQGIVIGSKIPFRDW